MRFIYITALMVLSTLTYSYVTTQATSATENLRNLLNKRIPVSNRYPPTTTGTETREDLVAVSSNSCPVTTCSADGGAQKVSDLEALLPGFFQTRRQLERYSKTNGISRSLFRSYEEANEALKSNTAHISKRAVQSEDTCCPAYEFYLAPSTLVLKSGITIYPVQDVSGGNYQVLSIAHCHNEPGGCSGTCQNTTSTQPLLVHCVWPVVCQSGCSTTFYHAELDSGCICVE
ncbi:uncharacterized protein LOC106171142 [Lingula anatina]|uniref:Uncharacterized protein LOC106171142 n=1 Tax=Lingula anatina TaxID=7574 RepID=A0A1S3J8M9_LINAN|nr:uncharacterized protein LOC106171142 [Lingula anatina]|eukprot:XP_013406755.1 uncharacterized protein LOC106171142 [Lingula anatina]